MGGSAFRKSCSQPGTASAYGCLCLAARDPVPIARIRRGWPSPSGRPAQKPPTMLAASRTSSMVPDRLAQAHHLRSVFGQFEPVGRGADRHQHCEKRMRDAAVAPVDENVPATVDKHIPIVDFFVRQRFRQSGACQLLAQVYQFAVAGRAAADTPPASNRAPGRHVGCQCPPLAERTAAGAWPGVDRACRVRAIQAHEPPSRSEARRTAAALSANARPDRRIDRSLAG